MKPLKILFVINSLRVGGTEQSLAAMLPHLVQANIRPIVTCFYSFPQSDVQKKVLSQGIDVRFINETGLVSRAQALRRLINLEQPDLIQTALFEADMAGRLAAIGSRAAVMGSLVTAAYTPVRFRDPNVKAAKLRVVQFIDSLTARYLVDHFHAVSQAAKQAAVTYMRLPPERITVIERGRDAGHLGQPSPERRRQARLRLDLSEKDEVLVNIGRHEYAKGQPYLLAAMEQLIHTHPRLVLLVAGPRGNASSELERLHRQAELNGQVRFLGYRDDVSDILAAADLFVFPSLYEGLPGAVIEAMALGLPIVATNIAPLREVVEENSNALLVEPASPTQLATAIETLLKDRTQVAAFGQRSREIFETRFTVEQSVSRMVELYQRVVALK